MGERAKDMINGACCSLCGCYFIAKDGSLYVHYTPVVCHYCYYNLSKSERKQYQRAKVKTF